MSDLTPKQELFIQEYLLSGFATRAYKKNYKTDKMTESAIVYEAKRMLGHAAISARINELRADIDKEFQITAVQKKQWLSDVAEDAMAKDEEDSMKDRKAVISVVAELNRMDGHLAPTKTENKNEHTFEDALKQLK